MDPKIDALADILLTVALALAARDTIASRDIGDGVRQLLGSLARDGEAFLLAFAWLERFEEQSRRDLSAT